MKKLTRHKTFEALKQEAPPTKPIQGADSRLMSDFQDFLTQLHSEFSLKKKTESMYGKKSRG